MSIRSMLGQIVALYKFTDGKDSSGGPTQDPWVLVNDSLGNPIQNEPADVQTLKGSARFQFSQDAAIASYAIITARDINARPGMRIVSTNRDGSTQTFSVLAPTLVTRGGRFNYFETDVMEVKTWPTT